jgi:hypothetical protein
MRPNFLILIRFESAFALAEKGRTKKIKITFASTNET